MSRLKNDYTKDWPVVVAQLVELLLPTREVCSSNPVIDKLFLEHLFTVNCIEKTKMKKKRPGMTHLNERMNRLKNGVDLLDLELVGKLDRYPISVI